MLSFLESILEVLKYIPNYILYAVETVANLFFSAIQGLFEVITSLIPLPAIPTVPDFIANLNWFFPVGLVITVMGPILTGYIGFLLIRWAYKWSGNL